MLALKYTRKPENYTWPGFVDALASLLMVIIFVLMTFVIAQFYVSKKLLGKDEALIKMEAEIFELNNLLSIERKVTSKLSMDIKNLEKQFEAQNLDFLQKEKLLQKYLNDLNIKNSELTKLENELINKNNLISNLNEQIRKNVEDSKTQKTIFKQKESELLASKEEVKRLLLSTENLKQKINKLKSLLMVYQAKDKKEKVKNLNLGKNLNTALARRVEELQKFKSEFFGRVKDKIKNRPEIKVVGDRFVFQSEVLFQIGSANIGKKGEKELERLASILLEIEKTIPKDINWILQIEGHTDSLPVKKGQEFKDNWELSSQRALSVLRFFVKQGLNPKRLSASAYGSFQPLIKETKSSDRAKNRRIEMKITQKLNLND